MKYLHVSNYFYKFSDEVFGIQHSFANSLDTGETVSSCVVTIKDSEGTDYTSSMISNDSVSSPNVSFTISNGTSGETYQITLTATSSGSNIFVDYITCEVYATFTLNSKLGDFNANSYITVKEANDYIRNKYGHTNTFDTLSFEGKKRILVEAAKTLDMFNIVGKKYYDAQPMEFPRSDHDVITGVCATPITATSFKYSSLKSTTYNKYPQDYWKYGSCHLTDDNEVGLIASSNVTTGVINMFNSFTASLDTNTNFKVFKPIYNNIKYAQAEQALYLLRTKDETLNDYKEQGANSVSIGDVSVSFVEGDTSRISISPVAKKLLSRWIRKNIRIGRG